MPQFIPGVPDPSEYKAYFAGYIEKAARHANPCQALQEQHKGLIEFFGPLDEQRQLHRYAPGKWSIKEVFGHIIDTERVMSYRLLRAARGDQTPLPSFDENLFVANASFDSRGWMELLHEFSFLRRATILLLEGLPEEAWMRRGVYPDHPMSVRALAYVLIGHPAHHLDIVRERYLGQTP